MDHPSRRRPTSRRPSHTTHHPRRRAWCCSFTIPPSSPDNISIHHSKPHHHINPTTTTSFSKSSLSVPTSPQSTKSSGFTTKVGHRIDPRRILSPGRVSPIDSDPTQEYVPTSPLVDSISTPKSRSQSFRAASSGKFQPPLESFESVVGGSKDFLFDVRLNLKGKNGGCMVLELNSDVLGANSEVFAELISDHKKGLPSGGASSPGPKICRIEVPEVENFGVFKETIELMFEDDITKRLTKIGVYRSIDILEVS